MDNQSQAKARAEPSAYDLAETAFPGWVARRPASAYMALHPTAQTLQEVKALYLGPPARKPASWGTKAREAPPLQLPTADEGGPRLVFLEQASKEAGASPKSMSVWVEDGQVRLA